MERGPVALFGAIVAIGIGPALWLGAQFGNLDVTPNSPPSVVSEQKADKAPGGAGAAPEEPTTEPTKRMRYVPLSGTPSARPSSSATADADEPDEQATTDPASAEPTETDDPTTPPVESTTGPADPEGPGNGDEEPVVPQPPAPGDPAGGQAAGETGS